MVVVVSSIDGACDADAETGHGMIVFVWSARYVSSYVGPKFVERRCGSVDDDDD